jgi:hypothetical protein
MPAWYLFVSVRAGVVRSAVAGQLVLATIGGGALLIGVLLYATDRAASPPLLLPLYALSTIGPLFGAAAQWLPSFIHPLAFGLLSAAAGPRSASPTYGVCAAWWAVNVVFEIAQHPSIRAALADAVPSSLGRTWPMRLLMNYLNHGTFDLLDIAAATAGGLCACLVLFFVHRLGARHAR